MFMHRSTLFWHDWTDSNFITLFLNFVSQEYLQVHCYWSVESRSIWRLCVVELNTDTQWASIVSSNRAYRHGYRIKKIRFEHIHPSPVYYFIFFCQDTASVFAQAFPKWGWKSAEEFCDRWWEAAWKWRLKSVCYWKSAESWVEVSGGKERLWWRWKNGYYLNLANTRGEHHVHSCFFATKSIRFIASVAYTVLCSYLRPDILHLVLLGIIGRKNCSLTCDLWSMSLQWCLHHTAHTDPGGRWLISWLSLALIARLPHRF